ncbi:MAG TPA: phage tail sheath C-terminal domain-containing protein, partial [Longimicrobium sp.]|nr:phage tail sheath C-terminal domain-containing protein [Longimicrobium sp.]
DGRFVRSYPRLSAVPEHPRYGPFVLAFPEAERRRGEEHQAPTGRPADLQGALPPTPEPVAIDELRPLPLVDFVPLDVQGEAAVALTGGTSGLALLRADDFMGEAADPMDSAEARAAKTRGFRALDAVDEVTTVAIPDLHVKALPPPAVAPPPPCPVDPCIPETAPATVAVASAPVVEPEQPPELSEDEVVRVQQALVDHCALRADRLALLDPPRAASLDAGEGPAAVRGWRRRFSSSYAVAYWPWLGVVDPLRRAPTLAIPPSGHVAGQLARTDFAVGVHRAPANFPLDWVHDVTLEVDEPTHAVLNTDGINVARPLPGRGIRLMGARTLHPDGGPLRFVNVRRLLLMIRASLYRATQWAAFEPNDYLTRAKLQLAVSSFLQALWERGALAGDVAGEAYQVKCDEENNPQAERDEGRLLADVAVAPVHPMEFVVVRVGRTDNEMEIAEAAVSVRGA